jgi:hypothetical protein
MKKIYITENQYNNIVESSQKKYKKSKQDLDKDYIKAHRKQRRDSDRELFGDGFKSTTRINKSEKNYSRKGKNKFDYDNYDEDYDY